MGMVARSTEYCSPINSLLSADIVYITDKRIKLLDRGIGYITNDRDQYLRKPKCKGLGHS
jgi:hypothetical protein